MPSDTSTQSTGEQASTTDDATVRFEKDVLITAYAENDYNDARTFMDDVFGEFLNDGEDLWETETSEDEKVELEINFEIEDPEFGEMREFSESISPFNSRSRRLLKNAIKTGMIDPDELDWLDASVRMEKETNHVMSESRPLQRMIESIGDDVVSPQDFGYDSYSSYVYDLQWTKDVDVSTADSDSTEQFDVRVDSCHSTDIERRRVLTHQAERTANDRYETPEDVDEDELPWSVQVSIHIESEDEDAMDAISEDVVTHVNSQLALLDGIEKTRLTDCEKTKQEQGACYQF